MKKAPKKKGGKRKGAGRKPSGIKKEALTIYSDFSKFGGKDGARIAIYEFLDGKVTDTGRRSFLPLPISKDEIQQKIEEAKARLQPKTKGMKMADLKPQEPPTTMNQNQISNEKIERQISVIKAEKIPKERDTVYGRKSWEMEQKKRIQDLKNQLK